jgi:hypothetical protein
MAATTGAILQKCVHTREQLHDTIEHSIEIRAAAVVAQEESQAACEDAAKMLHVYPPCTELAGN